MVPIALSPFEKPDGGWTASAGLGTEDLDYGNCLSEEFFELEREAVFRQSWLMVGLEHQLPHAGSYFTKELPVINTSILVTRGTDGRVRAFHNMCSHRGNKLVWNDNPREEVCGIARQFVCKYHAWRFALDGELAQVNMEEWFFDLDKRDYGLTPVHCETWQGFIFINATPEPAETLTEFLGELAQGLGGYPFEKMTQSMVLRVEVQANWKLWMDAFQEQYHGTTLHARILDWTSTGPLPFAVGSHFEFFGRTSLWHNAIPFTYETMPRPLRASESLMEASLFGPRHKADLGLEELPRYVNRTRNPFWTSDTYRFFPNFEILNWERGWAVAYTYWPVAVDRMVAEARILFVPPRNASERLAQELVAVETKEALLQDANTLEATHFMLGSRAKTHFPISDEEVQIRNNHKIIQDTVDAYRAQLVRRNGST